MVTQETECKLFTARGEWDLYLNVSDNPQAALHHTKVNLQVSVRLCIELNGIKEFLCWGKLGEFPECKAFYTAYALKRWHIEELKILLKPLLTVPTQKLFWESLLKKIMLGQLPCKERSLRDALQYDNDKCICQLEQA